MSTKRTTKPAAAAAPVVDPAMLAAIMAALQAQSAAPAQTVAMTVVAEPAASIGSYNAEGWVGKNGEFCVTVRRGRARNGITFTAQAQVDEIGSPLFVKLVAQCCKAAGKKLGAK
jgi:hypothetical protein